MILERLSLSPFAAVRNRSVEFLTGLTVILGPNEAGKSTLFRALSHVLLTPTGLTPRAFETTIGPVLPRSAGTVVSAETAYSAGDTVRVSLTFRKPEGRYSLERTWARGNRQGRSRLVDHAGVETTQDAEVERRLMTLLPAGPASVREVLLTGQSSLALGRKVLDPEDEVRDELGSVLRRAVMETGGISVERLQAVIDARYEGYFSNWDRNRHLPRDGRGIENPHRKNVGSVLGSFYRLEGMRRLLDQALSAEREIDELNEKIRHLESGTQSAKNELERLVPLREGVRERQTLESELRAVDAEIGEQQKTLRRLPVAEDRLSAIGPELNRAVEKSALLVKELDAARAAERARTVGKRAAELSSMRDELRKAEQALLEISAPDNEQADTLRALEQRIQSGNAMLAASKLSMRIHARNEFHATVGGVRTPSSKIDLAADATEERLFEGSLTIQLPDAEISVTSGTGEADRVAADLSTAEDARKELLSTFGVTNADELEGLIRRHDLKKQEVELLRDRFTKALGEDDLDDLIREGAEDTEDSPRSIEDIAGDRARFDQVVMETRREQERLTKEIAELSDKYGSFDALVVEVGRKAQRQEELRARLTTAAALPEGFAAPEEFFTHVDELERQLRRDEAELSTLLQDRARAEVGLPEESVETMEGRLTDAIAEHERLKTAGEAVARVQERMRTLVDTVDSATFTAYQQRFSVYLNTLSNGRISGATMSGAAPVSFTGNDGTDLPFPLLSWGTRDTVALALRLVMAEQLLGSQGGFLVLDDPMVDMDPARRALAAGAIKEFAARYQTVLFTCHPAHAEALGGATISLEAALPPQR